MHLKNSCQQLDIILSHHKNTNIMCVCVREKLSLQVCCLFIFLADKRCHRIEWSFLADVPVQTYIRICSHFYDSQFYVLFIWHNNISGIRANYARVYAMLSVFHTHGGMLMKFTYIHIVLTPRSGSDNTFHKI